MLRALYISATIVAVSLLFTACGGGDEKPIAPKPAAVANPTPTPTPTPAPTPPAAPEPAPTLDLASGDASTGKEIYTLNCATCHGATGAGDGVLSASLDPKPARHNDGSYMNALSNDHLFKVISKGGMAVGKSPLMAPWAGVLDDQQIVHVIAYLRTIADPPYPGS